jgi:hypothetical protein
MGTVNLPPARALPEGSRLAPHPRGPTVVARLSYGYRRLAPAGRIVIGHLAGLFPILAVVALALGLVWGSALAASP